MEIRQNERGKKGREKGKIKWMWIERNVMNEWKGESENGGIEQRGGERKDKGKEGKKKEGMKKR